jgi:hypothetical protein
LVKRRSAAADPELVGNITSWRALRSKQGGVCRSILASSSSGPAPRAFSDGVALRFDTRTGDTAVCVLVVSTTQAPLSTRHRAMVVDVIRLRAASRRGAALRAGQILLLAFRPELGRFRSEPPQHPCTSAYRDAARFEALHDARGGAGAPHGGAKAVSHC